MKLLKFLGVSPSHRLCNQMSILNFLKSINWWNCPDYKWKVNHWKTVEQLDHIFDHLVDPQNFRIHKHLLYHSPIYYIQSHAEICFSHHSLSGIHWPPDLETTGPTWSDLVRDFRICVGPWAGLLVQSGPRSPKFFSVRFVPVQGLQTLLRSGSVWNFIFFRPTFYVLDQAVLIRGSLLCFGTQVWRKWSLKRSWNWLRSRFSIGYISLNWL